MTDLFPIQCAGEELYLLADFAMFWPRTETLLIADPHFGKPSAFRQAGIPVPLGTTLSDLHRLTSLIERTKASRLIVLGDFFHHRTGQCDRTMDQLGSWRREHDKLLITIIMGNHDRSSNDPPAQWNVDYHREPVAKPPFLFCHEPCKDENLYVLSGHIHPAIRLNENSRHGLTLPCFLFSESYALVPAFGGFTGTASVKPQPKERIYAIVEEQIIQIPNRKTLTTSEAG